MVHLLLMLDAMKSLTPFELFELSQKPIKTCFMIRHPNTTLLESMLSSDRGEIYGKVLDP